MANISARAEVRNKISARLTAEISAGAEIRHVIRPLVVTE